jgi:acyl dehydratase
VRFIRPVLAGSFIRARIEIAKVDEVNGATQTILRITFEVEEISFPNRDEIASRVLQPIALGNYNGFF